MNNPHTPSELAYLAGIIDGEGTITLERAGKRRLNGVMGLNPVTVITNTDEGLIQHCINTILRFGIKPFVKSQPKGQGNRTKRCYWLVVKGLTKNKKILSAISPYLVAKYAQAQLILNFIAIRGDSKLAKGKQYGKPELLILDKIRALNHRGVSETEDHGLRCKVFNFKLQESNDSPI